MSLLTAAAQLSLEANSRIYGSSILKIEPSSLKRSILYCGNTQLPTSFYKRVESLIMDHNKIQAVNEVTEFFDRMLSVPKSLSNRTKMMLDELRARRSVEVISGPKKTTGFSKS
jgi:hypothetical protein